MQSNVSIIKLVVLTALLLVKGNQSHYRPEVPRGFQEVKVPRLRDNGPEWWQGCQCYAPAALYPQETLLVLICVGDRGGTVVKMLCYKSEGRWFDPSWCYWNFSLT